MASLLTPAEIEALEIMQGLREPVDVRYETLQSLLDGAWVQPSGPGHLMPTDIGRRAVHPMKDITP